MAKSRHYWHKTFEKPATVNAVTCRRPSYNSRHRTYRKLRIN